MAKLATLQDYFTGLTLNTSLWTAFTQNGATLSFTTSGSQTNFPPASIANTDGDVSSNSLFDVTNSSGFVHVYSVANPATFADSAFTLRDVGLTNAVAWLEEGGTLFAQHMVSGVTTNVFSVAYDPVLHAWWRIREASGTTFWDTSADGLNWTNRFSEADPITMTSLQVDLGGSCFRTETNPGTYRWSNFNVAPTAPINSTHRILLEDNTSYLLLEDGVSKLIIDENDALDDPVNAATGVSVTPSLSFSGQDLTITSFDSSAIGIDLATSPVVWSHTVGSGPNRLLVVTFGVQGTTQGTVTAVTFNGVSMVKAAGQQGANVSLGNTEASIWFLFNPPVGTFTVSVTATLPTLPDLGGASISYFGVAQTSIPHSSGGATGTAGGSITATIPTTGLGAWVVYAVNFIDNGANLATIMPRNTLRVNGGLAINLNGRIVTADTNGSVTPGTTTVGFTATNGTGATQTDYSIAAASFIPASPYGLHYEIEIDTVNTFDSQ